MAISVLIPLVQGRFLFHDCCEQPRGHACVLIPLVQGRFLFSATRQNNPR